MIRPATWLLLLVGCAGQAAPSEPAAAASASSPVAVRPGDIAITDVSVIPMSKDGVLEHHTVVIRGDRIAAVAPASAVALADGVTVIDGAGKWLMPGLADMHVHTWHEDDLTLFLAAGVTTIRNMWGVPGHLDWRSQIARGQRLGPTIVTAGPLIDGDPPDWPGSVLLRNPAEAEQIVAEQKAAGYDFLKPVSRLSSEAYAALVAAGKRHGMELAGHVPLAAGLEGVLAAHQRSIEHVDGYPTALVRPGTHLPPDDDTRSWIRAVVAEADASRLPALVDQTIAAGSWNCPTLIAYERAFEVDDAATIQRRVKWLHLVSPAVRARWLHDYRAQGSPAEDVASVRAFLAELARISAALAAGGAPILVGTDTGITFVLPGESMHDEIELLVAAGVPRPRVLRAATADAWRYLGEPHEAGIIEVAARADLLLVATDPLTTPLPLIPDGVMVRGRWLPRRDLEERLAEVEKRGAPPADAWQGAPPLTPRGAVAQEVSYDTTLGGTRVGQERLAVGLADGKRTLVGQLADFGDRVDIAYELGPDRAKLTSTYHMMTVDLRATIAGRKLEVTGTDLTGKPVSLTQPVPAGAFLSAPGVGGSTRLAEKLAGLEPGKRRTLTSLELASPPAIAIVATRHRVERKPDAGGHRVYAVEAIQPGQTVASELVVDQAGLVVSQTFGPPLATTVTRRSP